jgi:hypothetical protein
VRVIPELPTQRRDLGIDVGWDATFGGVGLVAARHQSILKSDGSVATDLWP